MAKRLDGLTCTAKAKSTQKRCQNPPLPGGTVCKFHGGKAPQVLAKSARNILEALVGPALIELDKIVRKEDTPDNVRLAAVRDVLDRTGHKAPTEIKILSDAAIEADIERLEEEQGL